MSRRAPSTITSRAERRHHRRDRALELGERGGGAALAGDGFGAGGAGLPGGLEAGAETLEVRVDRLAVGADRRLENVRRDRQAAAAGDQAEHHRVDHGAALLGERLHVDEQVRLRMLAGRPGQPRAVVAAVAHRHLLHHQVGAAGRGDQQGAVGGDEARRDGAAGLHELARQHDVDVADAGRQREHRPVLPQFAGGKRDDLDVVGGGAGALGNARDRGRLHREAPCAAAATSQSVSTPPPSPPSAAIRIEIGRGCGRSCRRLRAR